MPRRLPSRVTGRPPYRFPAWAWCLLACVAVLVIPLVLVGTGVRNARRPTPVDPDTTPSPRVRNLPHGHFPGGEPEQWQKDAVAIAAQNEVLRHRPGHLCALRENTITYLGNDTWDAAGPLYAKAGRGYARVASWSVRLRFKFDAPIGQDRTIISCTTSP